MGKKEVLLSVFRIKRNLEHKYLFLGAPYKIKEVFKNFFKHLF